MDNERINTKLMIFPKRLIVISTCFFLLYAGVAWAVMACLDQDDHHLPSKSAAHYGNGLLSGDFDSPDRPAPNLHCDDPDYQIGPMAQTSIARLGPLAYEVPLNDSSLSGSVASGGTNDLWLRAFFEKFPSFSFLSGISLHLFLSVLRI